MLSFSPLYLLTKIELSKYILFCVYVILMIAACLFSSLCCTCGVPIPPNPANMCVACLRTQVDISEGIPKQVTVHFCKQCERFVTTEKLEYIYIVYIIYILLHGIKVKPIGSWQKCRGFFFVVL